MQKYAIDCIKQTDVKKFLKNYNTSQSLNTYSDQYNAVENYPTYFSMKFLKKAKPSPSKGIIFKSHFGPLTQTNNQRFSGHLIKYVFLVSPACNISCYSVY